MTTPAAPKQAEPAPTILPAKQPAPVATLAALTQPAPVKPTIVTVAKPAEDKKVAEINAGKLRAANLEAWKKYRVIKAANQKAWWDFK